MKKIKPVSTKKTIIETKEYNIKDIFNESELYAIKEYLRLVKGSFEGDEPYTKELNGYIQRLSKIVGN